MGPGAADIAEIVSDLQEILPGLEHSSTSRKSTVRGCPLGLPGGSKGANFAHLESVKSGMSLLECGCGSETSTIGLAEIVGPGNVIGLVLDMEESVNSPDLDWI